MKTIYYNGHIHTLRAPDEVFSAMAVEKGRVVWLGDTPPAGRVRRVDLHGMHVFPALTDSHLHLLESIVMAAGSFAVCTVESGRLAPADLAGVEQRVRRWCAENPGDGLVVATGYVASAIAEGRLPTRRELDEWTGGRRAIVYNIDGHSSAMSTALIGALGLDDPGDGVFAGEAHETIQGRVTHYIAGTVSPRVLSRGLGRFTDQCAGFGIARVCALDGSEDVRRDWLTRALAFLARRMEIDVRLYPEYTSWEKARPFFSLQKSPRMGGCGAWELDGSVGSRSAAFDVLYQNSGDAGHLYRPADFWRPRMERAAAAGVQLSCHAIGTEAISQALDLYEALPAPAPGAPLHRVDHFEFPRRKDVERIKALPLAVTVQPGFSWLDKRYLKSYERFLRPEVIDRQVPLRELVRAGVCLCGSSDSPVQSIDPFAQMLGMVEFYLPHQSLTAYEALLTYTAHPARMLGEQGDTGTLEEGKEASFFVCAHDLSTASPGLLATARAEYTVVRGRRLRPHTGSLAELVRLALRRPRPI